MSEIVASIIEYFKAKASTNLFGVFSVFWILAHSEGFICLFFTKQEYIMEKYQLLKNEYLFQYFFGFHFCDAGWWVRTLAPFILTALYILFIPLLINAVFKYEVKYKTDRKIDKAKENIRYTKEKNKLEEALVKNEQTRARREEAKKRQIEANPHIAWDEDYERLERRGEVSGLVDFIKQVRYGNNGYIMDENGVISVNIEKLSTCEAYELIARNEKNPNFITVTEKGWYFLKKNR